ncbi:hypothetical protein BU26DRAFT_245000 [Trematosphaeria pertusa]|uniref:Uncharacterized protein n=1 Tax=Trematosphaeria pertusa TaxID=390896 RepID=A0A6A6INK3_9PLEO|nr:uncharacterized protein BU26DRAFT_245000 [Trematosphaeria pertusa]KAF2251817.1 hypothetical protein BU26DRAFT_245000 [Trematosphaeria pertusa]
MLLVHCCRIRVIVSIDPSWKVPFHSVHRCTSTSTTSRPTVATAQQSIRSSTCSSLLFLDLNPRSSTKVPSIGPVHQITRQHSTPTLSFAAQSFPQNENLNALMRLFHPLPLTPTHRATPESSSPSTSTSDAHSQSPTSKPSPQSPTRPQSPHRMIHLQLPPPKAPPSLLVDKTGRIPETPLPMPEPSILTCPTCYTRQAHFLEAEQQSTAVCQSCLTYFKRVEKRCERNSAEITSFPSLLEESEELERNGQGNAVGESGLATSAGRTMYSSIRRAFGVLRGGEGRRMGRSSSASSTESRCSSIRTFMD